MRFLENQNDFFKREGIGILDFQMWEKSGLDEVLIGIIKVNS